MDTHTHTHTKHDQPPFPFLCLDNTPVLTYISVKNITMILQVGIQEQTNSKPIIHGADKIKHTTHPLYRQSKCLPKSCIQVKTVCAGVLKCSTVRSFPLAPYAHRTCKYATLGAGTPPPTQRLPPDGGARSRTCGGGVRRVVSEYQAILGETQAGESNRDSHAMLLLLHSLQAAETPHVVLVRFVHLVVG